MTGSRQRKSPAEKAVEALEVAKRRTTAAEVKLSRLQGELAGWQAEYDLAVLREMFLAKSPDLPADKP